MEELRNSIARLPLLVILTAGLVFTACSGGDGTGISEDLAETTAEITDIVMGEPGFDVAVETASEVAPELPPVEEVKEAVEETVEGGEFGDLCEDDSDCQSGVCLQTADGMACTETCTEGCPSGFTCQELSMEVWVCKPYLLESCMPCLTNAECGAGYYCANYGIDGNYCAPSCADGEACPSGYACKDAFDVENELFSGCILQAGTCQCNAYFTGLGAATACVNGNEWGGCEGQRACTEDGLSSCDAPFAEEEECDDADNDCDGEVDEGLDAGACTLENDIGVCPGTAVCVDGEYECQGQIPTAEVCDAVDNDCNGEIDEGFPDSNGDGVLDCLEKDTDEDGWFDYEDNCPLTANPGQDDLDDDGDGDECDGDDDGDGTADDDDCAPLDPNINPEAEEKCNEIDDNCNGETDEVFVDTNGDGVPDCLSEDDDGDGVPDIDDNCPSDANPEQENFDDDGAGDVCDLDDDNDQVLDEDDCAPFDASVYPGAAEICDGLDNDCDSQTDEDQAPITCGEGVCLHTVDACLDGVLQWCDPLEGAGEEVCDGLDNNCDGAVDEEFGSTTCGLGPCEHEVANCLDGVAQECDPLQGAADEECDGVDNDCDGEIDNGADGGDCSIENDFGACPGTWLCLDGQAACDAAVPSEEVCDTMDNDCNGEVDDGLGTISCGEGECVHSIDLCVDGELQECDPLAGAGDEICDGLDNDCDEEIDEELGTTTCGLGPCENTVEFCLDGAPQECLPLDLGEDEACDGIDNDCNGSVDDELGTTTCGLGECEHTIDNCAGGEEQLCDPLEGATDEVCDQLDNDCDGEIDEEGADGCTLFYMDLDEDGWGTDESSCLCAAAAPFTAEQAGDCNDDSPDANPGLEEQCGDQLDNDCVADTVCMWVTQGDEKWEITPLTSDKSAVDFYSYDIPNNASANAGLNLTEQVQLFLYEEPDGQLYMMVIVDDVSDGSGGAFTMTLSGLQGSSAVVEDDPGENGNTFKYDPVTGDAEFKWTWAPCCTDGVVVGPLGCADGGFEISITSSGISGIDSVVVRNPDGELLTVPDMTATFTIGKLADPAALPPKGEILPDCKAILDAGLSTGSGSYWVDPDGGETTNAVEVLCDMDTNGGGWTLCGKYDRDNTGAVRYLPAGFARTSVFAGNLGTVAGFCGQAASHDCRSLIQNGATQILNVGVDEDSTSWADGRIIDLHAEVIADPSNLWDVELDEDGVGECTLDAITTRDLDGVDLGNSDGGAILYEGSAIIGDGAFWTNDKRNGASFSNAGAGVPWNCTGTGHDTVYWSWRAADDSLDDHGCGAGAGHLQLGTGCAQAGTWQKPTYRYNMMFMR